MVENSKTESTEMKKIPLACTILANVALPIVVSRLHYHFYVSRQQNSLSKSIACQIYRYIKIVHMSIYLYKSNFKIRLNDKTNYSLV